MRCIIALTGPEDHGVRRIDVFSHGSLLREPVQWLQQWFGACLMEQCRKNEGRSFQIHLITSSQEVRDTVTWIGRPNEPQSPEATP